MHDTNDVAICSLLRKGAKVERFVGRLDAGMLPDACEKHNQEQ